MPMDAEPAWPRFVHKVQASVWRAQRAHDFVEWLEIAGDHAVMADLPVTVALGDWHVDRFLVDI